MNHKIESQFTDMFFECVLNLKTIEECYQFFNDICTIHEIQAISQRIAVAKMLYFKDTYVEITEKTGASTATISRVNRSLNYGNDGYKLALERLKEKKTKR